MPSLADYESAFMKAHEAGDTQAAQALAGQVRTMRAAALRTPSEGVLAAPVGGRPQAAAPAPSEGAVDPLSKAGMQAADDKETAALPWYNRLGRGVTAELAKQVVSLKGLAGQISDTDQAVVDAANHDTKASGAMGTIGGIIPQMVETAMPAGAVVKGAGLLAKAKAAKAALQIGAMGATNAAQDFVLNPGDNVGGSYGDLIERKALDSAKAGAIGVGLGAGGAAAVKAGTGLFKASKAAQALLAQGVTPTLAQGADSTVGRGIGNLTSNLTSSTAERQGGEVRDALMKQVLPDLNTAGKTNTEVLRRGVNDFQNQYDGVFMGKQFRFDNLDRDALTNIGDDMLSSQGKRIYQHTVQDMIAKTPENATVRMSYGELKEHGLDALQTRIDALANSSAVGAADAHAGLIQAKEYLQKNVRDAALNPEEIARLADIDSRYADFSKFKGLMEAGPAGKSNLDVNSLGRQYFKGAAEDAATGNSTPLQKGLIDPTLETLGSTDSATGFVGPRILKAALGASSGIVAPVLSAPVYGLSALGNTKQGARLLFGDYAAQKAAAAAANTFMPYGANLPADYLATQGN